MVDSIELQKVIAERLEEAEQAAEMMVLNNQSHIKAAAGDVVERYQRHEESLLDLPYNDIVAGFGKKVWIAVLFVDMRNSSKIAELYGERDVYLTIHSVLTALSWLVTKHDGIVVGFRGDGLFAGFGIKDNTWEEGKPKNRNPQMHIANAINCGKSMLDAIDKSIRPVLDKRTAQQIPIQFGVGIDANEVIVTRVGLVTATELTAYGPAVNIASKLCGEIKDEVAITSETFKLLPKVKGGTLHYRPRGVKIGGIHRDWGIVK
ncbi:MAG: adenylate/guanylate cyclase domain-containing protein [Planctomycetaceae bacterium]